MRARSLHSPVGDLTLFAEAGALVALEWGWVPDQTAGDPLLEDAVRQLHEYFDGRRRAFDLPLAPSGSAFERRVWAALCEIDFGTMLSYRELAEQVASVPRAIGRAVARNPLPILIPCHRVVGSDGALVGYSGGEGIETKRALLVLEGALAC
ncbi:MAG: methylated-DNA--[protein]-cysteine S-methyltransferase [Alphaproteobacteria bacterium]|nr:MAG: methylated-DNA--[protein]-cysteine S-methyltransferase [Alphaproteobacteria bacterium]